MARPQAADFTAEEMTGWYLPHDLLGVDGEHVIPETSTFAQSLAFMAATVGLPSHDTIEAAPN